MLPAPFCYGERQTDFINCVVWNKAAENVEHYCSKGSLVGVEGRIQSRQYDAQDGTKRTVVEVICDTVQFIETKRKEEQVNPFVTPGLDLNVNLDQTTKFEITDDDIQF